MHPMPLLLRLGAVEHVEDARRLAGSGCVCCGCIASAFTEPFGQPSGSSEARRVGACRGIIIGAGVEYARGARSIMTASPLCPWPYPRRCQGQFRGSSCASSGTASFSWQNFWQNAITVVSLLFGN